MRFPKHFPHFLTLTSATAWELLLLYNMTWLRSYYIESGRVYVRDGIPACWFRYSPSLPFVLLVLLPAIVLPALYVRFKEPLLRKSGLAIGLPVLSVVLVSLRNPKGSFSVLLAISVGVGVILGEGREEKALLFLEGFLPGFIVFMIILGGLAVSC
ncbi:hypothetical protein [Thermococcus sp. 21S7]|uniref:hypothetical protein n=1 Tax=Thermococcus sp. 21S7 TaxID=1638221 RepID=UPI00143B7CBA|nr:hypothetical protein [Thermococcus sp. 21S7]NJE61072.1 hypothetical protein [Thermococcus sp. 21S7]